MVATATNTPPARPWCPKGVTHVRLDPRTDLAQVAASVRLDPPAPCMLAAGHAGACDPRASVVDEPRPARKAVRA